MQIGMIRLNGHYLYEVGSQLHPLADIEAGQETSRVYFTLLVAEGALAPFLQQSVFVLRTSQQSGFELLELLQELRKKFESSIGETGANSLVINQFDAYRLKSAFNRFEAVVAAELQLSPLYILTPKGAYDVDKLALRGKDVFPPDLEDKVPACVPDVVEAMKCLAYQLNTACGFHLHRANESVIRAYFDAVTGGAERPKNRNIGDYLNSLDKLGKGDSKVKSALRDLKDLHRNPLIHPDDSIDTTDEAIALVGSVQAVVTHMLREIPQKRKTTRAKTRARGG